MVESPDFSVRCFVSGDSLKLTRVTAMDLLARSKVIRPCMGREIKHCDAACSLGCSSLCDWRYLRQPRAIGHLTEAAIQTVRPM
jgi:hypothetical protein